MSTEPSQPNKSPDAGHPRIVAIFGGLMVTLVLGTMDRGIVSTALPVIVADLGGLTNLAWVVTAYILGLAVTTPIYGKLGDQFGRRPVYMVAISVFLAGSILAGTAQSMGALIGWRALQGMGAGGFVVLAQAIVFDVVGPRGRARYQGHFAAVLGSAAVLGPVVGGLIADSMSWRYVFWVNIPFGILALILAAKTIPNVSTDVSQKIDWLGFLTLGVVVSSVTLITTWGGVDYAWGSPVILGLVAVAIMFVIVLVVVERRAEEPAMPLHLFSDRTFNTASMVTFLTGFALFGVISFLPLFLQEVTGVSATSSGVQLLPLMAGLVAGSTVAGRIIGKTGRYRVFPILGTAIGVVAMGLLSTMDAATSPWSVAAYAVTLGLGAGMIRPIVVIAVQSAVPVRDMGTATAGTGFFGSVGSGIGVAVVGALFNVRYASGLGRVLPADTATRLLEAGDRIEEMVATLPEKLQGGYVSVVSDSLTTAFLFLVPVFVIAFLVAWMMPSIELRDSTTPEELGQDEADPDSD